MAPSTTTAGESHDVKCTSTVEIINGCRVARLTHDASAALPSRGQVAVTGSINQVDVAMVVEPDGFRGHWLDLATLPEQLSILSAGAAIDISLTTTKQWPEPSLPDDFQNALDGAPDLSDAWPSLTPMARWEWVRWINATKNPSTRARRIEVAISKMRDGKRRPCCFDLSSCTNPNVAKSGKLIAHAKA
jgi:hypothetical protein